MNMKQVLITLSAVCFALLFTGCSKDNDWAFEGDDNYITSFKLTLDGDNVISAYIVGETITVTIPEEFSLAGAIASISISENAKIYPDPVEIEDWDNEQTFVVSSYNGKQNIYRYTIRRETAEPEKEGNFILFSQTDVNNFASLGIEKLNGNLTIGKSGSLSDSTDPDDPITSLAPLALLIEVTGNIIIYACPDDYSAGFMSLQRVGSIKVPQSNYRLKEFIFPELVEVYGDIYYPQYNASKVTAVYMPRLVIVGGNLEIGGLQTLASFSVPELKIVMGYLSIRGNGTMGTIEKLSFPKLEQVSDKIDIYAYPGTTINAPLLKTCGGLVLQGCSNMVEMEMPALEQLFGTSKFSSCNSLKKISLPKATYIENIELNGLSNLEFLEIPELKTSQNINFYNLTKLANLSCLGSLVSVEGTLSLQNLSGLTEAFSLPASLTNIGELVVSNLPGLTELDIRGTGIKSVGITTTSTTPFKLTADDVMEGSLTLSGLFELSGMKEVMGNVSITMSSTTNAIELIPNMETVNGNFTLTYNYTTGSLNIPSLQTVGGNCKIKTRAILTLPKLKQVGQSMTYDKGGSADNGEVSEFTLPELTTVGGDFIIYTGHTMAGLTYPQTQGIALDIKMPKLTVIEGILKIHTHENPSTSTRPSNRLANLNGFSPLSKVKGVDIYRQAALRNFEGLKNAIGSFTADDWVLSLVGYIPTYEDLAVDGKYIDPAL